MALKYEALHLIAFATSLLEAVGMPKERAQVVAQILVEGDLMGHTTHGLQLLAPYLEAITSGGMKVLGEPKVIADKPAAALWDGDYLPGPWLVVRAFEEASRRARELGTGTVVIRRCHHIACLAAYFPPVVEQNLVGLLYSSSPDTRTVAPHGGTTPVYSPNPLGAGFPTNGDPVILDVSMSATTNGLCMRQSKAGEPLPAPWVKDANGVVTTDPSVVFANPPGSILPLGGVDSGHKGYAMGLLVEALTSGLGGYGRADGVEGWGAAVTVQVLDPELFGGVESFIREQGWLANACRASQPPEGQPPVRLPGERALRNKEAALKSGVELYSGIMTALEPWCEKLSVTPLSAL